MVWHCGPHRFDVAARPLVLGIVNVTPDSFSDGGLHATTEAAVAHALKLASEGTDLLDIGGESTRPGATPVSIDDELDRVVPVIRAVRSQCPVPISIDTRNAAVAEEALKAGACIINDVSGFRDPTMIRVAAGTDAGLIAMHLRGDPTTMQIDPNYDDVVTEIGKYFDGCISTLISAGIDRNRIALDPGIGFGKTLDHTLQQLARLGDYGRFGLPICLGASRKGFLGQITGRARNERLAGTLAVNCFALAKHTAHIFRVHDVAEMRDAVLLWRAIRDQHVSTIIATALPPPRHSEARP